MQDVVAAFKDNSKIQMSGLYIAGQKYLVLRADDESIYAKQVCPSAVRLHEERKFANMLEC